MKIVITAGGTAGHINPAIALAEELVGRGHEVVFAGTPNRLEAKLIPKEGYKFQSFEAVGFNRKHPVTLIKSVSSIQRSTKAAVKWLKQEDPAVVVGFGCYVSMSICKAAKKLGIPYVVHEQNSVMGLSNKYLSRNAAATCLTYKHADTGSCNNVIITGNPVRKKVLDATKKEGREMLDIPMDAEMLLVFGGSLGAAHINQAFAKMALDLMKRKNLYVVHVTGNSQYDDFCKELEIPEECMSRYKVLAYQNKMGETLAAADCCVSRSGASSLAEIAARCLPALLVPYPLATENHQYYNAKPWVDAGCACLIEDKKVGTKEFEDLVSDIIDNEETRNKMFLAAKKQDTAKAAKTLSDVVLDVAK